MAMAAAAWATWTSKSSRMRKYEGPEEPPALFVFGMYSRLSDDCEIGRCQSEVCPDLRKLNAGGTAHAVRIVDKGAMRRIVDDPVARIVRGSTCVERARRQRSGSAERGEDVIVEQERVIAVREIGDPVDIAVQRRIEHEIIEILAAGQNIRPGAAIDLIVTIAPINGA